MHPAPPGFHKAPFEPSADPAFIFHHGSLEKARAEFMLSQISDRRGLFLVVGEPGSGKTTLLLSLRLQSGAEKPYAYLVCGEEESHAALVKSCCNALGVAVESEDAESLKQALVAHLTSRSEAGIATTLLIDAAENLTDEALEGLAEIAGADVGKRRLLHIVVVARPEIEAALERTGLDRAEEAIAFQCRLEALGQEEVEAYIEHRLKATGYEGPALFSEDALRRIAAASKGLPGQVSQICRAALQAMQEHSRATIEADVATYAIALCGLRDEHQTSTAVVALSDTAIQELWELAEGGAEDGSQSALAAAGDPDEHLVLAHYLKDRPENAPDATPEEAPPGRRPWLVPFDWEVEKATSEAELSEVLTAWKEAEPHESAMTWRHFGSAYWPAAAMIAVGLLMGSAFAVYQAPEELWAWMEIGEPDKIEVGEIQAAESIQDPLAQAKPTEQDSVSPTQDTAKAEPEASPAIEPVTTQASESPSEPPPAPAAELALFPVEAPRLIVTPASGQEDQGIPIDLQVAAGGGSAEVDLSLALAGLPEGTVLSAGTKQRDGTWALNPDHLSDLKLLPPEHYSGIFMIQATATAKRADGESATTINVLPVSVAGVADPPLLKVSDAAGREDEAVPLEIQAAQTDRDGSERLMVFVADLPEGASLSAGEHQGLGNWSLTAEQLSGLELLPPEDFSGSFTINAGAMAQETDSDDRNIMTGTLTVTITAVADVPQLKVSEASGREDQAIPLDIEAAPSDGDGSEQLEIFVAGLPEGARLSAGDSQGDGKWSLTRDQLTGLELLPPKDFNGRLELTAGAISREPDSDDQAVTSSPVTVTVAAVTDAPRLTVSDSSGSEDNPIPLDIRASLKEGIGAATLSILLSNLPEGAQLSAGSDEGDGRWTLQPDQLTDLKLNPPPSFGGTFEITAEAIAKEVGDKDTAATTEIVKVTVAGVADPPRLAVKQAIGREDKPIPLDITASLGDADGSEKLSIILTGLPKGAQLSAGEADANGVWRLTEKQLPDLKLVPPPQFSGEFEITAGAISLEDGGSIARTTQPLKVKVTAAEPAAAETEATDSAAESEPGTTQQAARPPSDPKVEGYMGRGDALLALGDVASARLFYELALDHGHARAATAIGKTYDPLHLRQLGVHGAPANKAKAIEWYKQAIRAGDTTATLHLKILSQNQN